MYKLFGKRFIDILVSLIAMIPVGLVMLVVAPIIYLTDRGSVFYNAPRMGMNGKTFTMYKFRSMRMNAPDLRNSDGSTYNGEDDPRVTKIGKIMRKTSIDELPQLLNVLKGDMSLVGPRPTLASGNYAEFDEVRRKRLTLRPGITGYSQAYFRNSITQDEKFANDCYYVDNVSFAMDVKVLFKTALSVFMRKNIFVTEPAKKEEETLTK